MTYRGRVKNRRVLVACDGLPDGVEVRVETRPRRSADKKRATGRRIMRHAGSARGLPPDASRNLDHYLSGNPAR